ncbi:hypothetical protein M5K25_027931 [Dendrobium thyrsiflorum]|uniref:Uncharacterized protein n=1 Tax=Dendrobium thyrsiflorum TaxID=117978 RepID=A0ABD0TV49_DENTH
MSCRPRRRRRKRTTSSSSIGSSSWPLVSGPCRCCFRSSLDSSPSSLRSSLCTTLRFRRRRIPFPSGGKLHLLFSPPGRFRI